MAPNKAKHHYEASSSSKKPKNQHFINKEVEECYTRYLHTKSSLKKGALNLNNYLLGKTLNNGDENH